VIKPKNYTSFDSYTTGSYTVNVQDEPKKAVLYTADGKPLGKSVQRIGFAPEKK
jgi:hypothetical protein